MRQTLSVIVITKNEEDRIARCLKSIEKIADEIIVFDSGSTDKTVDIVRQFTDKVFITDWQGFGIQKQRALEKATCNWVLSLDADEEVDEQLASTISALLKSEPTHSAYKLRWRNIFLGKVTRFGRTGRAPTRLFKRETSHFTKDIVHEKVVHQGDAICLKGGYLKHYSVRDFEHLLYKNRDYTCLMATKKFKAGKKSHGIPLALLRSMLTFIQIYIFRLGILDGSRGLLFAVLFAQYQFNKYAGLWALEQSNSNK